MLVAKEIEKYQRNLILVEMRWRDLWLPLQVIAISKDFFIQKLCNNLKIAIP